METTNEAYALLSEKLTCIETAAAQGILSPSEARGCCMEIKACVYKTRQILDRHFFIAGRPDRPPAA